MSKIVCDICGTTYQDSNGSCPVCGWNQSSAVSAEADDFDLDSVDEALTEAPAEVDDNQKNIFDFDAVNDGEDESEADSDEQPDDGEEEDDEEEEGGSNTVLVVILVILILALLGVSAFIGYKKFIEPRKNGGAPVETVAVETVAPDQTTPAETAPVETAAPVEAETEAGIPCVGLSMAGGIDKLTEAGQKQRFMVRPDPSDTTDKIVYASGNDAVVTIDENGTVTAVGEGETVLIATCGDKRIETAVVVSFAPEVTEPVTEAAPAETVAPTTAPVSSNGALKLKGATDRTIGKLGVYITLELEGGITADEVKWSTSDSSVATVYNGNVTATGRGICTITGRYNDQKVECTIRVKY